MTTLNIKVNGKTETCTLYSTKGEAGDNPMSIKVGENLAYAAMTTDLADSGSTSLRVKMNGATYAVLKEAGPKRITLILTIGISSSSGAYGYSRKPTSNVGNIEPQTFLGDEFVGIEASESSSYKFFHVGIASNPRKSTEGDWCDFDNANHAYLVEIPQFNFAIKAGKGYTDNVTSWGMTYIQMAMPQSTDEMDRMFNLFKANLGKRVKVVLTVIDSPN